MKCHDEPYETSFNQANTGSINKFNKETRRRINKIRNFEIARERWADRIEKFIEARNLAKAFHDDEEDRLESIAIELWKLKNVDECCEPKEDSKGKKCIEDIGTFLRAQIEEKENLRKHLRLTKTQENCLASLDLKIKPVEEEAIEKYKKRDELRRGLLAQIKDNCMRNCYANEERLREGSCLVEKDIQLLKERQIREQEASRKKMETAKAAWQLQEKWRTEALRDNVRMNMEIEEQIKKHLSAKENLKKIRNSGDEITERLRRELDCEINKKERDERMRIELSWMEKDEERGDEERRRAEELINKKQHWKDTLQQFIRDHLEAKKIQHQKASEMETCLANLRPCWPDR